jgi:predicted  nucleic acid-binding Zn-ribbon protein
VEHLQAVLPALASLIALQKLDSAAEAARTRIAELPAAEESIAATLAASAAAIKTAKTKLAANQESRRSLEKDVAGVDARLARFEDHKAAVKTNHEYTALLHEIETAKTEKDQVEERILILMEEGDELAADVTTQEAALADATREGDATRAALADERKQLEEELERLAGSRKGELGDVDAAVLARYDRLLQQRKGIAVARITGDTCSACHVRLRPHFEQMIRRNDQIIQCESCQRILYYDPPADA